MAKGTTPRSKETNKPEEEGWLAGIAGGRVCAAWWRRGRKERWCWSHLVLVDDEPEVEVEGKRRNNVEEASGRRQYRQCEVPPRDGRDFIVPSVEGHFSSDAPHPPLPPRR